MPLDAERVEAITVESDGTLVDPDAAGEAIAPSVDDPERVLAQWRAVGRRDRRRRRRHTAVYRHAAALTGTTMDRLAHVAGPSFDVRGRWRKALDRTDGPWDPCFPDPDLRIDSFHRLVDALAA